jgi:hypothetical protein
MNTLPATVTITSDMTLTELLIAAQTVNEAISQRAYRIMCDTFDAARDEDGIFGVAVQAHKDSGKAADNAAACLTYIEDLMI